MREWRNQDANSFAPQIFFVSLTLACIFLSERNVAAYSVMAHESVVDSPWNDDIVPLLRARFRGL